MKLAEKNIYIYWAHVTNKRTGWTDIFARNFKMFNMKPKFKLPIKHVFVVAPPPSILSGHYLHQHDSFIRNVKLPIDVTKTKKT